MSAISNWDKWIGARMEIRRLRHFVTLAEEGSFIRGARKGEYQGTVRRTSVHTRRMHKSWCPP